MPGYLDEPHEIYTVEYVRADLMASLQSENERLRAFVELVVGSFDGGPVVTFTEEDMRVARAALEGQMNDHRTT